MLLYVALAHAVASSWVPSCAARDGTNLWFVFEGAVATKESPAPPDFLCHGLFFETVSCPNSVGMGKVSPMAPNSIGQATWELRYLPYGDDLTITGFLNKDGGGVLFKPLYTPATPSVNEPPPSPSELFRQYLIQRKKASQATQDIKVHVWTCPAATFDAPTEEMEPNGMKLINHVARAPL